MSNMDRRQIKTKQKVREAFTSLAQEMNYEKITVEDVLKRSGVARSTFYSHYKSKEDVLIEVTNDIFAHVFSNFPQKEADHDFSDTATFEYKRLLTHLFYHIEEEKDLLKSLYASDGASTLTEAFRKKMTPFFSSCVRNKSFYFEGVPERLQVNQLTEGFLSLTRHWVEMDCMAEPEKMSGYFQSIYGAR